jgi:hypothetical protein
MAKMQCVKVLKDSGVDWTVKQMFTMNSKVVGLPCVMSDDLIQSGDKKFILQRQQ